MHDAALVYVVDDDAAVRRALSRLLGSVGLAVHTLPIGPGLPRPSPNHP